MKKILALLVPALASAGFVRISPARRNVDSALAHINKGITELKAVKALHDKEAEKHEQAASKADAEYVEVVAKAEDRRNKAVAAAEAGVAASVSEAQRAARVAAKLEALLA